MKTVGIIGGLGPETTAEFYLDLVFSCYKKNKTVRPSNSLHVFIEDIRKATRVPVLSIIEETVKFLQKNNFKKVGIISTSATIKNRLYEKALTDKHILYETPNGLQQAKMGRIIHNLVMGQHNNKDREELIKIIGDLKKKKVSCVALACTDLQLLIPKYSKLKIFDTMKIFVEAVVAKL